MIGRSKFHMMRHLSKRRRYLAPLYLKRHELADLEKNYVSESSLSAHLSLRRFKIAAIKDAMRPDHSFE